MLVNGQQPIAYDCKSVNNLRSPIVKGSKLKGHINNDLFVLQLHLITIMRQTYDR